MRILNNELINEMIKRLIAFLLFIPVVVLIAIIYFPSLVIMGNDWTEDVLEEPLFILVELLTE